MENQPENEGNVVVSPYFSLTHIDDAVQIYG